MAGKFDDELHDSVAEQGDELLDQIAASAPLSTKGNEKAAAPKAEEETDKNSPVYYVPKHWKKLIVENLGASFSAYAKMAVREKLQRDGLI